MANSRHIAARPQWRIIVRAAGAAAIALCCAMQSAAATAQADPATVRSKLDMHLWQAVPDRSAPLAWPWIGGADSATLLFSNRVTRTVSEITVARNAAEIRGSCAQVAPPEGEAVVDVVIVQSAGGGEIARGAATLAYVNGAGGGPVEVRVQGGRDWRRFLEPRVFVEGSGYAIAWPAYTGAKMTFR